MTTEKWPDSVSDIYCQKTGRKFWKYHVEVLRALLIGKTSLQQLCGIHKTIIQNIPGSITYTTKPVSIGRRSSRLKTFAGIDSTSVSVLSGTIPANWYRLRSKFCELNLAKQALWKVEFTRLPCIKQNLPLSITLKLKFYKVFWSYALIQICIPQSLYTLSLRHTPFNDDVFRGNILQYNSFRRGKLE